MYDIEKIIKEEQLTHEDLSYAIYSDACIRAATDTSAFNSFKTNPNYIYELEHTSKELGENYISQAKEEFHKELMELNWEKVHKKFHMSHFLSILIILLTHLLQLGICI